jgi:hypothetical protein
MKFGVGWANSSVEFLRRDGDRVYVWDEQGAGRWSTEGLEITRSPLSIVTVVHGDLSYAKTRKEHVRDGAVPRELAEKMGLPVLGFMEAESGRSEVRRLSTEQS